MKSTKSLRFAPLVRVSTEAQEKVGESLRTQKKQIIDAVESLGGTIPEYCWQYSGQEHATPDSDRQILNKLLDDAFKDKFDAVMVTHPDRWSRDNRKSADGIELLQSAGIKFFVLTTEHDLRDEKARMFLALHAVIGEYHARTQSRKSIENRIERAKRGIPTNGKLPFGRTFDYSADRSSGTWSLEENGVRKIRIAARMYLRGDSMDVIAKRVGMKKYQLWKVLTQRCGPTWKLRFREEKLGIDESVIISIPPLLDETTIRLIQERTRSNKTYTRGVQKNRYLLSGLIFCDECGLTLFGQTNRGSRRYYRPSRASNHPCELSSWIPADDIEKAVLAHLFATFGNINAMEHALEKAFPNKGEIQKLRQQLVDLENEKQKNKEKVERIVNAIADGTLEPRLAKGKLNELDEQYQLLLSQHEEISIKFSHIPTRKQIKNASISMREMAKKRLIRKRYSKYSALAQMPYSEARELCQRFLGGRKSESQRYGVYVWKEDGIWHYRIEGNTGIQIADRLPMKDWQVSDIIRVPVEIWDDFDPWMGWEKAGESTTSVSRLPAPALPGYRSLPGTAGRGE